MILAAQIGSRVLAAQPTPAQLGAIAGYLESNDVQGLRDYLDVYPDLSEGDTTLARLLREFIAESSDVGTYLGFKPDLSDSFHDLATGAAGGNSPSTEPAY